MAYSFEYLKSIITAIDNINYVSINLLRDDSIQQIYENHILLCKKKHGSISKSILINIVNNFENPIVITKNTFPYNFEKNISHNLIWSKNQLTNNDILNFIKDDIKNISEYDYVWFENIVKHKSVPEIYHTHLILRKKKT